MIRAVIVALCAVLLGAAPDVRAQSLQSADALATWVNAVKAHGPGKNDRPLGFVAALKYSDRAILNSAMRLFLGAVHGQAIAGKSAAQRQVIELYRSVRVDPGLAPFLERAAILHADAAIFRDKLPDFIDDEPPASPEGGVRPGQSNRNAEPASPLLSNERAAVHRDGRVVGEASLNWHWSFARSLLDLLVANKPEYRGVKGPCRGAECAGILTSAPVIVTAADMALVAEWYHATSAYLMAAGKHADLKHHLTHAAEVLPEDARLLFDRGCLAETLGLPLYQVLPADPSYWTPVPRLRPEVPAEDRTDDEAEKLFRAAIAVDSGYAEARVRLARLLERRARLDEAAVEIDQAVAVNPGQAVAYFAHLVAGRIAQARGRAQESLGHYRAALAIFPQAQSALLGASQAAVMASDVPAATSLLARLAGRAGETEPDPWWSYDLGAGRDVDALMAALWAHVPR
ncbi:MAG TPA: tetratricopeptide repeat protein [Vicinamibacterales bacterium]